MDGPIYMSNASPLPSKITRQFPAPCVRVPIDCRIPIVQRLPKKPHHQASPALPYIQPFSFAFQACLGHSTLQYLQCARRSSRISVLVAPPVSGHHSHQASDRKRRGRHWTKTELCFYLHHWTATASRAIPNRFPGACPASGLGR